MSAIRAGTGFPDQRQAGCAKCCGGEQCHFNGVPVANPDRTNAALDPSSALSRQLIQHSDCCVPLHARAVVR